MKIGLSNISFQKQAVAKCSVVQNQKKIPCTIFELDSSIPEDSVYFSPLCGKSPWKNAFYLGSIGNDLYIGTTAKVYVMENDKQECISACEVDDVFDEKDELVFIETAPLYNSMNPVRNLKYAGETMLNFLVQTAKKNKKEEFVVASPYAGAVKFYEKCGFKKNDFDENMSMKLDKKEYNSFVKRNEEHVGQIEFIG
jgi:hypothetical protein